MKFAASTTLKRLGAGAVLTTALLSATGCGYIYNQPTTIQYAASDGVHADLADVNLRNIMVIAENENSDGRVLGSIINNSDKDAKVDITFPSGVKSITVPANDTVRLEDDAHQLIASPAGANPGHTLDNTKISVNGETTMVNLPVLDGTLEEYAPYLPNAASAQASETASPEASVAP